jgi:galactose mutarotase-like enzyme
MFRVERHEGPGPRLGLRPDKPDYAPGPIPTLQLVGEEADSAAILAPARGGMVIGLRLAGREILYLDRQSFEDPAANVRGGIPMLFPSPGKLAGDAWARDGEKGSMKQHGFARNLPWEVVATGTDDGAFATLGLMSNDVTRAQYPWDFRAEYTYRLQGRALVIGMRIENTGTRAMPFGVGFHPYFLVPDAEKGAARIPTSATRAYDNKDKRDVAFTGFDLTAPEVDMHLYDHESSDARLITGDREILLRGSPDFSRWVIWTLRGRDFVCVEPWTCPGNALNTGDGLITTEPGEALLLRLEIALVQRDGGSSTE